MSESGKKGFFDGRFGKYLLPGILLQSVLIGGGYATGREIVSYGAKFGAKGWIAGTISKRGRSNLRAVLFNAAIPLIATNPEFKSLHEYYTTRANHPLKKKQSVIAISCKLIRVFYAILANGVTYDAQKMLSDIHRQPQAA